jgi:hypothetical protein
MQHGQMGSDSVRNERVRGDPAYAGSGQKSDTKSKNGPLLRPVSGVL